MSRRPSGAVRTEGGLLPQDLLARIHAGDRNLPGTDPATYHLGAHERVGEAANRAWTRLLGAWHAFRRALATRPPGAAATGLTRERWLLPLFQELGYGRLLRAAGIELDGRSFPISHVWHRTPIHLLGAGVDLDRRQKGVAGAAHRSPHGLVQEFLNRSDAHLWGFVSNGLRLRLLRDHHSLTRQAYVEFDLQAILDGEQYSDFLLLWLVCHQSRVEAERPEDCWLERWHAHAREEGVRALDKLRSGVERAIEELGRGFLAHPANDRLRRDLGEGRLSAQDYYRQLLRLVYRIIFLFVAEERDLLLDPAAPEAARERYVRHYAARRLRVLAERRRGGPHGDLWRGLALVMGLLEEGYPPLALPALGSYLWGPEACRALMDAECASAHLLTAVRHLSHVEEGRSRYRVDWRNVGADELGSIYEGLLELHPRIHSGAASFELESAAGHERKTTGSYYTPTELVDCLLDTALDPVLDEACGRPDPEAAILGLKVCDPACGSGHFLVAAARRIARRLAAVRTGEPEPGPREVQRAMREVVGRCIYGVDLNPMAVELCKVSLWLEALEPGRPLSFLDAHIQHGNALLGATPALMARGIPVDAFKPIEGDDKAVAKRLRQRNRDERKGQTSLFDLLPETPAEDHRAVAEQVARLEEAPDDSIGALREKEERWHRLARSPEFRDAWFRADAWCAAFVWPKQAGDLGNAAVTHGAWLRIERDASAAAPVTRRTVRELARRYRFFHWHLAFPTVFGEVKRTFEEGETTGWTGGFDVVLGNPPWDRIKLQEKEFFAARAPGIAAARNAAARKKAIARLEHEDPVLWAEWKVALRDADGVSHLVRRSGRYPLCGRGDVNTYSIFAELSRSIVGREGRVGCIVPSGIVTDSTTQHFFRRILENSELVSIFDFVNRNNVFPAVSRTLRFCVMVLLLGGRNQEGAARFAFFLESTADLGAGRWFTLSRSDINLLNPNTKTCPTFRLPMDAELTKHIFRTVPIFLPTDAANDLDQSWEVAFASTRILQVGGRVAPTDGATAGLCAVVGPEGA